MEDVENALHTHGGAAHALGEHYYYKSDRSLVKGISYDLMVIKERYAMKH